MARQKPSSATERKQRTERRRDLRAHPTIAEDMLWKRLRRWQLAGRRFRRQHSIGPYIVDFYCATEKLVIELDGTVHDDPARRDYDDRRTRFLEGRGLRVLRFSNSQVERRIDDVLAGIAMHFDPPPDPLLTAQGGGER